VGCCRGLPYDGPWAITYADGIPRHPAPLYEMVFHWAMGFLLIALWRRQLLFGRLFAFYLVSYGVFRFFTEYLRETPKAYGGLSAYQIMSLAMIVAGRRGPHRAHGAATAALGELETGSEACDMSAGDIIGKILRIIAILVLGLFLLAGLVLGACFLLAR
jgi:hypothetical protein